MNIESVLVLTNIASAETTRGEEVILPGAHSDIGGGYKRYEEEDIYMSDRIFMMLMNTKQERENVEATSLYKNCWMEDGCLLIG